MRATDHVLDHVDDLLHDLLSERDARHVEEHCQACPICRVALDEARKRFDALQSIGPAEASEDLIQDTLGVLGDTAHREQRWRRLVIRWACAATAACIACLGSFHLYYATLLPSPYDLQVYGQAQLLSDSAGALRVRVVDHDSHTPLERVPIDIELCDPPGRRSVHLASFTTDSLGTGRPSFVLPAWDDGTYELQVVARINGTRETVKKPVELIRSWQVMLSTDKPVYQPGQTIHIRSLALRRPDLKPVAGSDVLFSITDPRGNIVFKQRDVTSQYGISSADCTMATEILEGPYTVDCRVGDTESRTVVEVKTYVLPKFRVNVSLDKTFYTPSEWVEGTVEAEYFFGQPVVAGHVVIDVLSTDVAPARLDRILTETDTSGTAVFRYKLPASLVGREQHSGDADVSFAISVTDSAAQEHNRTVSRPVTANPLRVEVIPESGALVKGLPNTVYLFATYADGRPAQARLTVSGITQELATNSAGVASIHMTPESDEARLTVRAVDSDGRVGRNTVTLACGAASQDFIIRTDRAVYEGGKTVHLTALGGGVEPVFVDFIKDGQTLVTETVPIEHGHGEYQFDLPPDLFGTIHICAYRFGSAGLPVRKTRVVYVSQARQLTVSATMDQDEYRPGHEARLNLSLTDEQGHPVPGAISLAAVDEAVFSVLSQAPGMENAFFNLEQDLLEPIHAIYPWSPDLTSSIAPDDEALLEQALFSLPAETRSGRDEIFQRMVDEGIIGPRNLDVLDGPYLEYALQHLDISHELRNVLQSGGPHTLSVTSYGPKARNTTAARAVGLRRVTAAWRSLAIMVVVGAILVGAYVLRHSIASALLLLMLLGLCVSIFLPSLSRARMSARRASAMADVRDLETALSILGEDSDGDAASAQEHAAPTRVRDWFPETLLWRPEIITDDDGRAGLDIPLADSMTTWRLTASAVSGDGRLGGMHSAIRVFQPFFIDVNLPASLTRGDEVAVPVVVYNYLDRPSTVELLIEESPWFDLLDDCVQTVDLAAGEVSAVHFRIRALTVGTHELQIAASSSAATDAIKRSVTVMADGERIQHVSNGTLDDVTEVDVDIPDGAIEGSARTIVKLYPSGFSQLVEGLDSVFKRPYGCFEQTSSTTYPNVLALDYLRATQQSLPEVEAKAQQYIHLGYQRLLSFEIPGGGFDWFGRPPANRTLTAYGLMEFEDMSRVHDVDPQLIERTRTWLLAQRDPDGSWPPESHKMHADPTRRSATADLERLSTTAYIAWSVFGGAATGMDATATRDYLLSFEPHAIEDAYVLSLVSNALIAMGTDDLRLRPYLDQLQRTRRHTDDGKLVWWEQGPRTRTTFYGCGVSGSIETTALATLAMLERHYKPATVRAALSWLVEQKDSLGTWHTTQATVLAFKALLAGTGIPLGGDAERRIQLTVHDTSTSEVVVDRHIIIPADQADVMKQIDLSDALTAGHFRLRMVDRSNSGTTYQVSAWHHVDRETPSTQDSPLTIDLAYDRSELQVGEVVTVTATVSNTSSTVAPMVILDLPIPAGFAVDSDDLKSLTELDTVAKYQVTARSAVVYLRRLEPGLPLTMTYRLHSTMPVRITIPPAAVYEYYNPDTKTHSAPASIVVKQRA